MHLAEQLVVHTMSFTASCKKELPACKALLHINSAYLISQPAECGQNEFHSLYHPTAVLH